MKKEIDAVESLLESANDSIEHLNENEQILSDALKNVKVYDRELVLSKLNALKSNLTELQKKVEKSLNEFGRMKTSDKLKSILCNQDGEVCINLFDEDKKILSDAISEVEDMENETRKI